ncbi:MAG: D-alanine--D-alanine ligase [Fidelibacterota bacterium]|nr:MAG: D-alanine--D-alanine ligase [Candidatus Neomarinimicrobiota bacterium]
MIAMPVSANHPTVAVLLGGINSEREVSMQSGRRVMDTLSGLGYGTVPVVYEGDILALVEILRDYDLVFNMLHGGEGEDGTIQTALDQAGISYTGSQSRASRLAMDKHASKEVMVSANIPTATWVRLELEEEREFLKYQDYQPLSDFLTEHSFPVVVKPNGEGSTVGLTIVENASELGEALLVAREFGSQVLVEAYIPGREITVTILNGRPLPIVEIVPKHKSYDYECKYTDGMSAYHVPAELPLDITVAIQDAARRLYEALGCRHYSRVDFRLRSDGEFFCLELNTLPGMTSHSLTPMAAKAVGIGFDALIELIVKLALQDVVD